MPKGKVQSVKRFFCAFAFPTGISEQWELNTSVTGEQDARHEYFSVSSHGKREIKTSCWLYRVEKDTASRFTSHKHTTETCVPRSQCLEPSADPGVRACGTIQLYCSRQRSCPPSSTGVFLPGDQTPLHSSSLPVDLSAKHPLPIHLFKLSPGPSLLIQDPLAPLGGQATSKPSRLQSQENHVTIAVCSI